MNNCASHCNHWLALHNWYHICLERCCKERHLQHMAWLLSSPFPFWREFFWLHCNYDTFCLHMADDLSGPPMMPPSIPLEPETPCTGYLSCKPFNSTGCHLKLGLWVNHNVLKVMILLDLLTSINLMPHKTCCLSGVFLRQSTCMMDVWATKSMCINGPWVTTNCQ